MTKPSRIRRKKQSIDLGSGVEVVVYYAAEDRPKIQWNDNKLVVISGDDVMSDPTLAAAFEPVGIAHSPTPVAPQSSLKPITFEQQEILKSRGYYEDKKRKENPSAALFNQEFGSDGAEIFKDMQRSASETDA